MTDDEDWTTHALCRDHVPLFDAIVDSPGTARASGWVLEAVRVCRACPVRARCSTYAVEPVRNLHNGASPRHGLHGVWAAEFFVRGDTDYAEDAV